MSVEPVGYFSDASMIRRVNGERAVALAGPRALLMQAAHPLAVSGLLAHSSGLDEPYERLQRTAEVMNEIAFGSRADANRMTAEVRAMHRRVRGRIREPAGAYPAGTAYSADAPELLRWVLFTLYDSVAVVYDRYVERLGRHELARLWADYRVVGRLFGLAEGELPGTLDDLDDYRSEMLTGDRLHVSDWARDRARQIVLEPPVPPYMRPLVETVNFVTVALLPDVIREGYGFSPLPPIGVRRALVASGAEYVRRVVLPFLPDRLRLVPAARAA